MNLPHAANQMPEKSLETSHTAALTSVAPSVDSTSFQQHSADPSEIAPIAVLILDRAGCVKNLNCAALAIFGELAEGQAWPLLRNATFKNAKSGGYLTARDGLCYTEQHSSKQKSGERFICLQLMTSNSAEPDTFAALGEGVARLVHQVRTPLTAAGLYLDQLTRQLVHEPKLQRLSRKPADQLRSAERVIAGALSLLKPSTTLVELHSISVNTLLRQLEEQCGVLVLPMGAHLHCPPLSQDLTIKAQPEVLLSALGNIVVNAAQHPAKGRLLRICVVVREEMGHVVFEISDSGKGVADEIRHKIFEVFESTRSEGTGLGLPVARQMIEQYGGKIELSHNAEGGATFSVRFPAEVNDVAA